MSLLFTPVQVGRMTVKNRFVRSATHEYMANPDGSISPKQEELYRQLAENDVGMIISSHSYVEYPRGRCPLPGQNGIYDDHCIAGYARLAEICHACGSKFVVQVSHAGVQTTLQATGGRSPVDPNSITELEILELEECFARAIKRVKEAGCDGAQLHIAHGYLLSRFLSPQSNRRQDRWGGSLENRLRFPVGIIRRAKNLVGDEFPILVKLNSEGSYSGIAAISPEDVEASARILEQEGVCAIEVSGGLPSEQENAPSRTGITDISKEAYFAAAAKRIKEAVSIPVILVGGLRTASLMESLIKKGVCDMVSLARPFICEPDLVRKLKAGQPRTACKSCNLCRDNKGIRCISHKRS